jgi:hypothetical protein
VPSRRPQFSLSRVRANQWRREVAWFRARTAALSWNDRPSTSALARTETSRGEAPPSLGRLKNDIGGDGRSWGVHDSHRAYDNVSGRSPRCAHGEHRIQRRFRAYALRNPVSARETNLKPEDEHCNVGRLASCRVRISNSAVQQRQMAGRTVRRMHGWGMCRHGR